VTSADGSWEDYFGHPEPYPEQADGIEAAVAAADDGGFLALEGACGTGKTALALTAGIDRVRDPDSPFERVVVLTSVKQQLRQFEEDLRLINDDLPADADPVSGLTLVGKADVCPYAREGVGDVTPESVYGRCDGLRERTRNLTGDGGDTTAGALAAEARSRQVGLADSGTAGGGGADYLATAGEPTPYRPDTEEYDGTEYCPFYAGFLEDLPADGDPVEAVPFDPSTVGHVGPEELVRLSAGAGSCPHSVMGALLPAVEVVIGNYYHAFDPRTVASFTGALIDEATFVICDEAHTLEPRVRELVSRSVADASLRDAVSELTRVLQPLRFAADAGGGGGGGDGSRRGGPGGRAAGGTATGGGDDPDEAAADAALVREVLAETDVDADEIERTRDFYEALRAELDRRVTAHLDREAAGWRSGDGPDDHELPLRDPAEPGEDAITAWAREAGYGEAVWARAGAVGAAAKRALDALERDDGDGTESDRDDPTDGGGDVDRAAPGVGRSLNAWYRADHETHLRLIDLERSEDPSQPPGSWRRRYAGRLTLFDCLPADRIADRLDEFGGGVLMSATLEPMAAFRATAGLDALAEAGRPVVERTYGLSFPERNRASFAVDAPKFTHDNRGPPGSGSRARQAHVDAATEVARRPGNVLVGMPSYAEAEWMAGRLDDRLDKPVLLDESSADRATESLKERFFAGDGKVLVTSLRGTLTEGVDYRGDRLRAAVVCGVPIVNTASPRTTAVVEAYDRAFDGRSGFETALTVPAVRKARQAVGRVIRGPDERGVRVLLDARYARESWNAVRKHLPDHERAEFDPVSPDMLRYALDQFEERAGRSRD